MVLHLMDKICMAFEVCLPFILYVRSALIYIGFFSIEEDNGLSIVIGLFHLEFVVCKLYHYSRLLLSCFDRERKPWLYLFLKFDPCVCDFLDSYVT